MNVQRLPTVVIENVTPVVDGGKLPLKRVAGEELVVEADVFKDGHDITAAVLKWRAVGAKNAWSETPMQFLVNDRWRATCRFHGESGRTSSPLKRGRTLCELAARVRQEISRPGSPT